MTMTGRASNDRGCGSLGFQSDNQLLKGDFTMADHENARRVILRIVLLTFVFCFPASNKSITNQIVKKGFYIINDNIV